MEAPDGARVLAVVATLPTTVVDKTRNSLFRNLFLVGLLTALVAFFVAVFVGERIGQGLRRLTVAAETIQRGDLSVRTNVTSPDEVGVLSATFDSMAESIETLAAELRQTAEEEAKTRTRLETVVAGMGEALVAVDAAGRITTMNAAAEDAVRRARPRRPGSAGVVGRHHRHRGRRRPLGPPGPAVGHALELAGRRRP